jgi:lipoic acid synthetase
MRLSQGRHGIVLFFDRKCGFDLTIGQYLRPSRDHVVMQRFYTPEEFAFL